jgi:adenylosuccinate lyase
VCGFLIKRLLSGDELFLAVHEKLDELMDPKLFIGRAPEQVREFLAEQIDPVLSEFSEKIGSAKIDKISV